ncbi:TPA: type I toxin-antitoxin system Ibs family toxin [Citrobacter braakii]
MMKRVIILVVLLLISFQAH